VRSRRVVGVEALSRLEVAPGIILGPASFIATVESAGLMKELSVAIVAESLRQISEWQKTDGFMLRLAVNITGDSIRNSSMPEFLLKRLQNAGIVPSRMTFEVTETQVVGDHTLPMEIFNRLHLLGIRLSIDDFGTGYSSFLQLKSLPFKELKIDRSFVSDALRDRAARAIIEASVTLAQKLGMKVVAEGVETQAEWDFIESLGVDEIQGYLVARPMDGRAFTLWMKEQAPGGIWRQ
jgi:EAL domain-containing protein (putative c-di-GMP-specific phosphodiesterase class I)